MFFQGQTLYRTYLRNGWSDWCETKRRCIGWILGKLCDLDLSPDLWPWPRSFKVKVWNSLIWGMGGWLTWNERDVSRSFMTMTVTYGQPWWGGWMYHIVIGVTSDVGVPSTYLVMTSCWQHICFSEIEFVNPLISLPTQCGQFIDFLQNTIYAHKLCLQLFSFWRQCLVIYNIKTGLYIITQQCCCVVI